MTETVVMLAGRTGASPAPLRTSSSGSLALLLAVEILLAVLPVTLLSPSVLVSAEFGRPLAALHHRLFFVLFGVVVHLDVFSPWILALLCALGAGPDGDIDWRRYAESVRLGHFCEIQVMHVEDTLQRVGCVSLDVRPESVFGALVKVVVLGDKLFQLASRTFGNIQLDRSTRKR